MKIKKKIYTAGLLFGGLLTLHGCKDGDLRVNPNASTYATPTAVLNHLTAKMVLADEMPYALAHRTNQYYVGNYSYYWGSNYYNWTNSLHQYELLRYAVKLEEQAVRKYSEQANVYQALAKFYRAYSAIWFSQRVGDIPLSEAGSAENLTPKYDTQKDVYLESLTLLEDANQIIAGLIASAGVDHVNAGTVLDATGDIFGLTNLQWQKIINAFRVRILVSMSNRADDTPDAQVKDKMKAIIDNPAANPLPESNADNMAYHFNAAYNPYPAFTSRSYTYGANIGKTLLDITTSTKDPRTFIFATPAPAQYRVAGKPVSDFSAYVGASTNTTQSELNAGTDTKGTTEEDQGAYSYINYKRYFTSQDGSNSEPYIVMGYAELCFNVAEAINRGWASGDAAAWYDKGIDASLDLYGLSDGQVLEIGDRQGGTIGTVTIAIAPFKAAVAYAGNNTDGLKQIVSQKYVAMFNSSGFEPFYNWLRTGYPTFQEGGAGIGTPDNKISRRWMYPQDEINYNNANYQEAIQRQYNGQDDVTFDTWLFKK